MASIVRGVGRYWVVVAALVAAMAGTAVAGSVKAVTKSKAKKIARNEVETLAPTLTVARAGTAASADQAGAADTALRADTAARADTATNATSLGGVAANNYTSSAMFGVMQNIPDGHASYTPSGIVNDGGFNEAPPFIAPTDLKLRDLTLVATSDVAPGEIEVDVSVANPGGADPVPTHVCTLTSAGDQCTVNGPFSLAAGSKLRLDTTGTSVPGGAGEITYSYRLASS
jgi:hypothetical protein